MTHRFTQEIPRRRQKRQTLYDYDYHDSADYDDDYYDEDLDYDAEDTLEAGKNPYPVAALAEGPLPQLVTLDIDLKYDRSLLNYFDGDHNKVKDMISRAVELAKPYLRHHSLGVMVDLNFVGEIEFFDETVKATREEMKNLVSKFDKQDRLVSIFATELIPGQRSTLLARAIKGIAYTDGACRTQGKALGITELANPRNPELQMSQTFAHETGHSLGIRHDYEEKHGGKRGACNTKERGLMSKGRRRPNRWSSCSKSDFEKWYRDEGYACLEAKEVPKESKPAGPSIGPPVGPQTFKNCSNKLTTKDSPSKGRKNCGKPDDP